jgi:hypothetical protein
VHGDADIGAAQLDLAGMYASVEDQAEILRAAICCVSLG